MILRRLIKGLIGLVLTIILVVGGTILIVNAKYGINIISVAKSLGKLGGDVDVTTLAPKAPKEADYAPTMHVINDALAGFITYDEEEQKYSISSSASPLSKDLKLTDTQVCILINWILEGQEGSMNVNIAGKEVDLKEYDFKVVQIQFTEGAEGAINYNVVMSISLTKIKDKMNGFPFSLLKGKVPDTLYLSSTVSVLKTAGAFKYEVSSVSLALNNMTGDEVDKLFKLLNIFVGVGDVSTFNLSLGKSFVDALIGNADVSGLTYSLASSSGSNIADFTFEKVGETIYYVMKKSL
ncbi:MAG TPA: hypothetical protein DCO89_00045 [Clostridiales bacterium]|nr:hypothetical protein [Clostridiales bacterium]